MTASYLPGDLSRAALIGRVWLSARDGKPGGPVVVTSDGKDLYAIDSPSPFCSTILASENLMAFLDRARSSPPVCSLEEVLQNSLLPLPVLPCLLSPVDLQAIKAAGVTFAASLVERLVEERAAGDPDRAIAIRSELRRLLGSDLSRIRSGTDAAKALEAHLRPLGLWSQYCEVGFGPYAEIFTKAQPLSTVGFGAAIGIHPDSHWNNPEPEVVLIVNPDQNVVGVTLGNDVNLRDFEGRSALLLGRAKDNNASCALGPFIRLIDDAFTLDDVRGMEVKLVVRGSDGFSLEAQSSMQEISRDILDLVEQASGSTHQYPDGFALMTGTLFAPTQDRDEPGSGFTHKKGDVVEISAPALGCLTNRVGPCNEAPPWTVGLGALVDNLRSRNLL